MKVQIPFCAFLIHYAIYEIKHFRRIKHIRRKLPKKQSKCVKFYGHSGRTIVKRVGITAHEYRVSFPWIFHFPSREFIQDFGGYFYCSNEFSLYFLDCTFWANNQDVVSTMSNRFLQHQEEMVHKMSGEGSRMVWRILHVNSTFTLLCFIWAKKKSRTPNTETHVHKINNVPVFSYGAWT